MSQSLMNITSAPLPPGPLRPGREKPQNKAQRPETRKRANRIFEGGLPHDQDGRYGAEFLEHDPPGQEDRELQLMNGGATC